MNSPNAKDQILSATLCTTVAHRRCHDPSQSCRHHPLQSQLLSILHRHPFATSALVLALVLAFVLELALALMALVLVTALQQLREGSVHKQETHLALVGF
jgi:hypothetical protein